MIRIVKVLAFLSFVSCAQFKSGHYIKLVEGDSIKKVSKEFNVSLYDLEIENKGKAFLPGTWVFIPVKKGIIPEILSGGALGSIIGYKEFIWPVPSSSKISSPFGKRWGRPHEGFDIAAQSGAHILASNDGVVVYSGNEIGGYGNLIILAHKGGLFSVYGHNKENFVTKGQVVKKGHVIARVGSTGKSTGPHLHFEVRRYGVPLNPVKFVSYSR